jgi:hypothetical protein
LAWFVVILNKKGTREMNIKQELKNNIRWIALKSGKTNKQVIDDMKKFEKIIFGNDRKVKKK